MGHTSNLSTWHNMYGSKDLAWCLLGSGNSPFAREWTLAMDTTVMVPNPTHNIVSLVSAYSSIKINGNEK
jgi:hypothetical protein